MRLAIFLLAAMVLAGCDKRQGEEIVRRQLRDPASAKFRDVKSGKLPDTLVPGSFGTPGGTVVCGEVNSKNGFGGFAGFQKFIADVGSSAVLFEPPPFGPLPKGPIDPEAPDADRRLFMLQWLSYCELPQISQ